MTTQDFIARWAGVNDGKERWCSSVKKDGNGNMYSYGYHYPLVFKIGDLNFINCAGYSSTTGRHILWAKRAVPGAVEVWLPRRSHWDGAVTYTLDDMMEALKAEHADIKKRMDNTKRKNTKKYQMMQDELEDCSMRMQRVAVRMV